MRIPICESLVWLRAPSWGQVKGVRLSRAFSLNINPLDPLHLNGVKH